MTGRLLVNDFLGMNENSKPDIFVKLVENRMISFDAWQHTKVITNEGTQQLKCAFPTIFFVTSSMVHHRTKSVSAQIFSEKSYIFFFPNSEKKNMILQLKRGR